MALVRTAIRLAEAASRRGAAKKLIERASGEKRLRSSLRKIKKRWHIPNRIRDRVEETFTDLFGKSPRGTTWSALAERYPERFKEYIDQAEEEADE